MSGPTTLSNALAVSGATTLGDTLDVAGAATLSNDLLVVGTTALGDALSVSGPTTLSNALAVSGPTTLGDTLDVAGVATLSNDLSVAGNTTLGDSLSVSGPTTLSNALAVSGPTTLGDTLDVAGVATLSNDLSVAGNTTLGDSLSVSGPTTLSNALAVSGPTTLGDTLDVAGAATLSNDLSVAGNTTLGDSLSVSGPTTLTNALAVSGPTTLGDTLDVAGAATLSNDLLVVGNTTLGDTLDVAGAATLSNDLLVVGNTTLGDTLDVEGAATLSNDLSVAGNTTLGDSLSVSGPTTLSNALSVSGRTTIGDALEVAGAATFSNGVSAMGEVDIDGDLNVAGDARISGAVTVAGAATFSNAAFSNVHVADSLVIPYGDAVSRPDDIVGSIRYNTDSKAFEGFTDTAAGWSSLGGAIDGDRDTYITTELAPSADDDTIRFYTSNELRASIDSNGEVRVYDALVLPSGDSASRPDDAVGSVRYNTDLKTFEGFADTGAGWSPLGGAIDGDRDTFILVEESPGADDDTMRFYTSNVERLRITDEGRFFFNAESNAFADECDFVFNGKACFSNVAVAGKMSVGDIDDLSEALAVLNTVANDLDPPYVEDYAFFAIPGTSNLGGAVSVEEAGDFRVYAYATLPGVPTFADPALWKRFYNKQVAAGNGGAFSVGFVANPIGSGGLMDYSNVDVGMYFDSTDTSTPAAPRRRVMENYHVYQMHLLVEDLVGRKTTLKRFATPMEASLRTNDVSVPLIGASNSSAVSTTPGGGRIDVTVTGITDDGIGALQYDLGDGSGSNDGTGTFGAPSAANPPHVATYAVALDRFQSFADADEAFAMLEAGCNMAASLSNYEPGALTLTTYYTRNGYGDFSPELPMGNYRYYSPYILIQDDHDPPNRAVHRMADTVTLDQTPPVLGAVAPPFADFATSNQHEMVFSVSNVVEDTKTLVYSWLMEGDFEFGSAAAASNFADARGAALIPHREMRPYEDLEFLPPLDSGEIRLGTRSRRTAPTARPWGASPATGCRRWWWTPATTFRTPRTPQPTRGTSSPLR